MIGSSRSRSRGWSRPRFQASGPSIVAALLVALVLAVAVDRGVSNGYLTLGTVVFIGVLLPSIMFHEVSHGVVALWCGDDTAKRAGRISANPIRHVDPLGTVIVPAAMVLLLHGFGFFGWAKPVPVALNKLRRPRNQALLVGLAGPASNGLLAAAAGVGLHFIMTASGPNAPNVYYSVLSFHPALYFTGPGIAEGALFWLGFVVGMLGIANLLVGAFNLLPIPPLDGAALVERFIPLSALHSYYRIRMWFLIAVVLLVWLDRGLLGTMFGDIATWYMNLVKPGSVPGL
ncbi:MAG TPA: site-2 protease family protein [Acidimicrobiales bacterium]|nr:site-2 protease family protein [Acidimicrobiales bacterium]